MNWIASTGFTPNKYRERYSYTTFRVPGLEFFFHWEEHEITYKNIRYFPEDDGKTDYRRMNRILRQFPETIVTIDIRKVVYDHSKRPVKENEHLVDPCVLRTWVKKGGKIEFEGEKAEAGRELFSRFLNEE